MLHGSQDYKFVVTEEFGIVSSYAPRTVFGDVQTMVVVSIQTSSQKSSSLIQEFYHEMMWLSIVRIVRTRHRNYSVQLNAWDMNWYNLQQWI